MATPEKPDKIEVWGRRIGRTLSYVLLIVLVIYLYTDLHRAMNAR